MSRNILISDDMNLVNSSSERSSGLSCHEQYVDCVLGICIFIFKGPLSEMTMAPYSFFHKVQNSFVKEKIINM